MKRSKTSSAPVGTRVWRSILLMTTMTGSRARCTSEDEARLRERTLAAVDEQERAVGHHQGALDLAAEVGVAWGVDDVDLDDSPSLSFQRTLVFFARIVIPRSFSRSLESSHARR